MDLRKELIEFLWWHDTHAGIELDIDKQGQIVDEYLESTNNGDDEDKCEIGTHDWDYKINPYQKTCKKCGVRYLA